MAVDDYTVNEDGHIIACPKETCGSRAMRKDGFQYWASKKRQRWYCYSCGKKTLNPTIVEEAPFDVEKTYHDKEADPEVPIDTLIDWRKQKFKKTIDAKTNKSLIAINIKMRGPIGIAHFGDPHVDDDGTDLATILHYTDVINQTEGMFAGNLGDIQNNWIGRLARLYAMQSTTAKESWRLTEYFVGKVQWLYLVAGNHDVWSGEGDPLEFMMRDHKGIFERHGARMNLNFPNGKKVRINARHTFKGNSMWNTAHGVSKAIQMGWRDHILTSGHTHVSGYQVLKDPSSGLISHGLQVASFKIIDDYADRLGMDDKNIFNCPLTIIDPQYGDDDNRLITTIFNPEVAAGYLTFIRERWKSENKKKNKTNKR